MPTDTTINNLVINKLTKEQYDAIQNPSETELYLVPDEIDATPTSGSDNLVSSGGVYTALSGKANTADLAAVATSGSYNDLSNKPTIPTVPTNISAFTNDAGYLTSQDINDKEDKVGIIAVSGSTLSAQVGKYYTLMNVGTVAITLPTIASGTDKVQSVTFFIEAGSSPAVTFASSHNIYYADGFDIAASSTYEVNALWNGAGWIVASVTIITS